MSSYYPVTQRPLEFELEKDYPLWKGCVFAGLGRQTKSFTYRDSSLYGNHGTLTNYTGAGNTPPERWSSALGRAVLSENGTSDTVINSAPSFTSDFPLSLGGWWLWNVQPGTYAYLMMASLYGGSASSIFSIATTGYGNLYYYQAGTPRNITIGTITAGVWNHYWISFDSATAVRFHLNGKSVTVDQPSSAFTVGAARVFLGGLDGSSLFSNVKVADPLIYRRSLSAPEISLLADPVRSIDYDGGLVWPRGRSQVWFGSAAAASSKIWTRLQQSRVIGGGLGA